jgi:hypothetical protein
VSAGAISTLDLPRDSVLKSLGLAWSLVQATATTPASGVEPDSGILSAIRRLEIVADGALTLWSIDPWSLYILNALWNGCFYAREDLAPPGTGAGNTLQTYLDIPFALPKSKDPNVTLLNAQALSSLQLRVTWGAIGDLYATVANTTIGTTSVLSCETHEIVGLSPRSVFSAFKVGQITRDISAASTGLQIDLPRGNVLRGMMFKTKTTLTGIERMVDTILNEIRMESSELNRGLFVHRRTRGTDTDGTGRPLTGFHIRQKARAWAGLSDVYSPATGMQAQPAGGTWLTGFYPLDFMEDGRTASALRTQAYSSLAAICNVSAPANTPQAVITTQEIIPASPPR